MITASLFKGSVTLALDASYDSVGAIRLEGDKDLCARVAEWLRGAYGFQGHLVGYPQASPRDLHYALAANAEEWMVEELRVTDAAMPDPLPEGAVS